MVAERGSLAQPMDPLLRLDGVSKTYRNPSETTVVFEGVDLELYRGQITCLVGPSGCGKSTIISLIAGLLAPDAGTVTFDGIDVGALPDSARARLRARRIGIVLQHGNLVPFLSTSENVSLAGRFAGDEAQAADIDSLFEQVALRGRAGHLPRRLSGGEAQRAALALALANGPDLLLADEVVGQLDSATARLVVQTLERGCAERGLSVLLVTHSDEVAAMGDRVVRLVDGRLEEVA